jgi:hypothetical protein
MFMVWWSPALVDSSPLPLTVQGASVFGTDYNADALAGTSSILEREGHRKWTPWRADMTESEEVRQANFSPSDAPAI